MQHLTSLPAAMLLFTGFLTAQNSAGLPTHPEPGKCYVRCVSPDEYETEEVKIMVRPEYKKLEVVPAEYKTVEEKILIKPATKKYTFVPAEFKTVEEEIKVEDPYHELKIVPASFRTDAKEIEVEPSVSKWEYQKSLVNCDSDDPRDCMVLCFVEYPSKSVKVPIEVLDTDARTTQQEKGGKTMRIKKQVVVKEAEVREIEIPAEYKTITKRVLVKDQTSREVTVPAEYKTETVRKLKKKSELDVWEEIDCKLTNYNLLPILYEFGSSRLTPEAKRIVDDKLLSLMKAKPLISIELTSHTDSRGSAEANMNLSQNRAEAVVDYLVSKGISRSRLKAKGFGETRLKNKCSDGVECTEEQHQANRRTEFRVLSN